jgi:ABC-2 type transport system ATP-binding protein
VQVHELTNRYRAVTALDKVSLALTLGRVYLLVGLNGAGKTTLLGMLAGLARPTRGSVSIYGRPFSSLERPAQVVGACLDPIQLPSLRSGRQHLACLAAAAQLPRQRVEEVLDMAGLPAEVASRWADTAPESGAGRHARVVTGFGRYRSKFLVVRCCQRARCSRTPAFRAG